MKRLGTITSFILRFSRTLGPGNRTHFPSLLTLTFIIITLITYLLSLLPFACLCPLCLPALAYVPLPSTLNQHGCCQTNISLNLRVLMHSIILYSQPRRVFILYLVSLIIVLHSTIASYILYTFSYYHVCIRKLACILVQQPQ